MRIRLLGPVEVWGDEGRLDIGSAKSSLVVAALTVAPGRMVPWDVLVDRVWGARLPGDPKASLYAYVARLRRRLEPAGIRILSQSGGYVCEVPPEQVDLARFRQRIAHVRGMEAGGAEALDVTDQLAEALTWWRGTPLANLSGEWVVQTRRTLNQERLAALLVLADGRSRRGRLAEFADDLLATAAEYPLSEPLAGYVIRALAAAGRRAEALDYYAGLRSHLIDELGEEPGAALQELHVRLLRGDSRLTDAPVSAHGRPSGGAVPIVPRQLPSVARHFVGRRAALATLDDLLAAGRSASAVPLAAISGTAGCGKTATAVVWAHQAAPRFPDGQLYVNLRGFDPTGRPMTPGEAIRGFLDAFAVPKERIPHGLDAQAALYRSLVAGRRMLVVLDNARDADQVRPLLPGAPGCLALVTSRSLLTGLVAGHSAVPIALDLLDDREAEQLLSRYLGAERVAAEPEAVRLLIERCARLPLALTVAAARALLDPARPLAALAAEVADASGQLDALDTGDPSTTARAVFSWSYLAQRPEARRLFRLLGLHPGPDVSVAAAASLAGWEAGETASVLSELTRAHLVTEHVPARYLCHDLLRSYAAELVRTDSPDAERDAAFGRMAHHYLHSSIRADQLLDPHRKAIVPTAPPGGVTPEAFGDQKQALRWFEAEREVLLAVIRCAADVDSRADADTASDLDDLTWELAWAVASFLDISGHWRDWLATQQAAMRAAERAEAPARQAHSHRLIANANVGLARYDAAADQLGRAFDHHDRIGDLEGQANCRRALCRVRELQGRYDEALTHAEEALRIFQALDDKTGQARALNAVGWLHLLLDDPQPALDHCRRALALFQELGSTYGEAVTWDSVGGAHHKLGQPDQAVACYRRALDLIRGIGDQHTEAEILTHLGDTYQAVGDDAEARAGWRRALELYDQLEHPDAEDVRSRLHQADRRQHLSW